MTNQNQTPSELYRKSFTCPHCGVLAQQDWSQRLVLMEKNQCYPETALCKSCDKVSIWVKGQIIYPLTSFAPKADDAMPDDVKEIYEEASLVSIHSPRAAAVLLRVATERLTAHLGESEGKLYDRIRNLAKKKHLDERAIKGFDIVRYKANKGGAHDNIINQIITAKEINKLFFSINYIVKEMINEPAELDDIYGEIPQSAREQIAKDDKPKDKK